MMKTVKAIVRNGQIELLEKVDVAEGTELLVTVLADETQFWLKASQTSLNEVWDNTEDDVYGKLLEG